MDNINAKIAMTNGVAVMDLAVARLSFNFISACFFVLYCKQNVLEAVPSNFKCTLTYRSVMQLVSQVLNVFSISVLPLSLLTIL